MSNKLLYNKEHDNWLMNNKEKYDMKTLTKEFNIKFNVQKNVQSIQYRCQVLGLTKKIEFNKEEKEWILNNWNDNKTYKQQANEFKEIFNYEIYPKRIENLLKSNGIYKKRAKRDVVNWGHELGEEFEKNGYIFVKTNNSLYGGTRNYMPKHHVVWEKHNGQIPRGYSIIFKDNNKNNFDINNLACVSNRTLSMLNWNDWNDKGEITETAIMLGELMDLNDKERDENECSK